VAGAAGAAAAVLALPVTACSSANKPLQALTPSEDMDACSNIVQCYEMFLFSTLCCIAHRTQAWQSPGPTTVLIIRIVLSRATSQGFA
jgi:hypothetical protein